MNDGSLSPIIIKYEKVLEQDPRSRSFAPLAEAYRQVGLVDKAFELLKKGLRYNSDYLLGYLTLALCYLDKKEYGLAYTTLKPLISNNRENIKLQRVFAQCAKKTNNLEEALDSYKYLLFLNPKDRSSANEVLLLEEELHEDPVFQKKASVSFRVDDLKVSPAEDKEIDDWVQVDFAEKQINTEEDDWSVEKHEKVEELEVLSPGESSNSNFDKEERNDDMQNSHSFDEKDNNILKLERNIGTEESEKEITPVITYTLVDIYIKQGHFKKAQEILEQMIAIDPKSENAQAKMKEVEVLIKESYDIGLSAEDEGRDDLMAAFDKNFSEKNNSNNPDDDERAEDEFKDNSTLVLSELELVFDDYLFEIKERKLSKQIEK